MDICTKKIVKRLKVLLNSTVQIVLGKKRQECSTLELHSLANLLTPQQMDFHKPGCLSQKLCALKTSTDHDPFILLVKETFLKKTQKFSRKLIFYLKLIFQLTPPPLLQKYTVK